MKPLANLLLLSLTFATIGCERPATDTTNGDSSDTGTDPYEATDGIQKIVEGNISEFNPVAIIDHSRLALKEEVTMPPSVVSIYSDPKVNVGLMKLNPRVGLDLPQKVLVFEEAGKPTASYPISDFLAQRHGMKKEALADFDAATQAALTGIPEDQLDPVGGEGVSLDYGVTTLVSDFPHAETIARLREAVMGQGDTVWFGELDFKAEASAAGVELPNATLLLFGGPKPGGVAMAKFPKLGLDAFCQKLLVYEEEDGTVKVIFNDIAAMAKLHYGTSAKPHDVINQRLTGTFEAAIGSDSE